MVEGMIEDREVMVYGVLPKPCGSRSLNAVTLAAKRKPASVGSNILTLAILESLAGSRPSSNGNRDSNGLAALTLISSFACRTGAHLCLGQYLAKMEMRILFEDLLPRLNSLALDAKAKLSQPTF